MSRTDLLICILAITSVIGSYAVLWRADEQARLASVWVGGEQRLTLPLNRDDRVSVSGPLGQSIIEVRQRRVRVAASPGPRQICVRMGWLERSGESAICLPNQVVVRLEGSGGFDAMNF